MNVHSFEITMGQIIQKYGHNKVTHDIPEIEFEPGGLFRQLAKDAGFENPDAFVIVNGWTAWTATVDELIDLFQGALIKRLAEQANSCNPVQWHRTLELCMDAVIYFPEDWYSARCCRALSESNYCVHEFGWKGARCIARVSG